PLIVAEGPGGFDATIDTAKLAQGLTDRGYKARVSKAAGQYLCEEMLYTLEYLKSTKQLEGNVMFCHVPPLGTKIGGTAVTADYVEQFIWDLLETWYAAYQSGSQEKERAQDVKDVKEFVNRYFRTWSEQDIKGYDACFMPDACIQHIGPQGQLTTSLRAPFIASQRDYHMNSPDKTTEVPVTIDIRFEEKLARAVVYWKLTAGARTEWGYDHFTLLQHEGNWRIVNLVFYSTPAPKKKAG